MASRKIVALSLVLVGWAGVRAQRATACDVPVCRFALERWIPDPYELVVFHRGQLKAADKAVVAYIEGGPDDTVIANCVVGPVDLAGKLDEAMQALWKKQSKATLPWMVLRYPERFQTDPTESVWAGPLTMAAAKALLDSPLRREVSKRLAAGDSAVWILLASGTRTKDEAAAKLLAKELAECQKLLKPPELVAPTLEESEDIPLGPPPVNVKIAFSLVRLSRTDPAEKALVRMLLKTEPELETKYASEPVAYPVFGRGRALYAFVGKGINTDNIRDACAFLVGPCSCMVKEQNPGVDLLFRKDWEAALGAELLTETTLPPLMGLPEAPAETGAANQPDAPAALGGTPGAGPGGGGLLRNIIVAVVLVVAAAGGAAWVIGRKRARS